MKNHFKHANFFFFFFDEEANTTTEISPNVASGTLSNNSDFFNNNVRMVWHKQNEKWYFSIVDVIGLLTEQPDANGARNYWKVLKNRLRNEGSQLVTNCNQLKMKSHKDGKFYKTDAADTEQLLRLIQSIPSKKAEPFKLWLAQVGSERLDEMVDPEIAIERAVSYYKQKGYDDKWIAQRLRGIEIRKELTDEWKRSGIEEHFDFAKLTNTLTKAWSGKSTREYKEYKGLKKENLRDNMTNTELALNLLAEVSTTELSRTIDPQGLKESMIVAKEGGSIAGNARKELEEKLGRKVISPSNAKDIGLLDE